MARTFIGELILRMKDNASSQAQTAAGKMESSMDRINRAAKRLGDAPWGGRFQAQIDKLGASAQDIDRLRSSWDRLQASFAKDNLSKSMKRTQIENWKTAAVGHYAAVAAGARDLEKAQSAMNGTFRDAIRLGLFTAGAGSIAYFGGRAIRGSLVAASEEQRERARQHFAGLPKAEQHQIEKQAGELSVKYRTTQAAAMEIMREARLAMPSAEAAFSVAEEMIQAYKMLGLIYGPDQAITGLRAFNKAMDNINVNQNRDEYRTALDSYIKAQQITGKDMDPEGYAQAIKYTRTSGKVFGHDFLFNWMPYLISETSGSDIGGQLRAAFDQFVVGRASKQSKKKQAEYGLRDDSNRLIGQQQFGENPITWIKEVLLPQLEKKGVDTEDPTELARVLGELTNNRLSSDLLSRVLISYEQYKRQVELATNAVGLDGAKDIDSLDPFSAFKGFKDAVANLAGAVMPMQTISTGLVTLADGINSLQRAWRDGDPMAKAGIAAGAGAGIFATWKGLSAIWALTTAGPALNSAAGALHLAAASLSGAGAAGKAGATAAGGSGVAGWAGARAAAIGTGLLAAWGTLVQSVGDTPGDTFEDQVRNQQRYKEDLQRVVSSFLGDDKPDVSKNEDVMAGQRAASGGGNPLQNAVDNATRLGGGPVLDTTSLEEARQKAAEAEQAILSAASVSGTPVIDTSNLERALSVAKEFKATLRELMADAKSVSAPSGNSVTRQMNRNFTDHGVVP